MIRLAHLRLAALGAALAVPGSARAGDYPYAPGTSPSPAAPVVVAAAPAPAAMPAPLDHKHYGRVKKGLVPCERCAAAAKKAQAMAASPAGHSHNPQIIPTAGMPEGSRIVACAHSSNGVCQACKTLLEMPGEVTYVTPGSPTIAPTTVATAPGRAVATDAPGHAVAEAGEPMPVGVMRTNYMGNAPARPAQPATPMAPGAGPFLGGDQHAPKPHILGHLFGWSEMQYDLQDKMDEANRKKKAKHAAISYDATPGKVQDLPASMVFGPGGQR